MNNLLSYCGLVDAKIRASDKDLPFQISTFSHHIPQPTLIFNREKLQNFKSKSGLRRSFDFIALSFPTDEKYRNPMMTQPLALVFITDFTVENGGTALRPSSHKEPTYPKDQDEFFAKAVQVVGRAGDIVVMRSSVQHCAMPNRQSYEILLQISTFLHHIVQPI